MSTNENETTNGQENEQVLFAFKVKANGEEVLGLYTDENGTKPELPEVVVIPDEFDGKKVEKLDEGMFQGDTRVKKITLPEKVTEIPDNFCFEAKNLRVINGTENITKIGQSAFGKTRIRVARFPKLVEMGESAFTKCVCLEAADIGAVREIPEEAFSYCVLLREVHCEGSEVKIGAKAFYGTRGLRELSWLDRATVVANGAFYGSSIRTDLQADDPEVNPNGIGVKAFPTFDNTTDFWTGVKFTPCCNKLATKLSQYHPVWREKTFLLDDSDIINDYPYSNACALFAVMHIHSAITGKYYAHPVEFVGELNNNGLSQFLYYDNWPGQFHNVAPMFESMGYRTKVYGTASDLSKRDYKAMVDALAQGAYIYAQVSVHDLWINGNNPDTGHAVVIYGINDLGEVCVLDSGISHENFRQCGFDQGTDVHTYTIPIQNLVGPSSNFVIVYPDVFTADSLPSDLRTGLNVLKTATPDGVEQNRESVLGCLTAYHLFSDPAKAVEEWRSDDGSQRTVRFAENAGKWGDWKIVDSTVSNNTILIDTEPKDLPAGVNISMIADSDKLVQLPEGEPGHMTVYNLFPNAVDVIEEWQPNGSTNKYVRYALDRRVWSDWYVVAPPFLYHK